MENTDKKYKIISSRFMGDNNDTYTYEITFNKSLEHTGKFKAIEEGLDRFDYDTIDRLTT